MTAHDARGKTKLKILQALRGELFAWIGVIGTTLSIISSIGTLIQLATWVRYISMQWQIWMFELWNTVLGWVNISVDPLSSLMLTANVFLFWVGISSTTRRELTIYFGGILGRRDSPDPITISKLGTVGHAFLSSTMNTICFGAIILPFVYGLDAVALSHVHIGIVAMALLGMIMSKLTFEFLAIGGLFTALSFISGGSLIVLLALSSGAIVMALGPILGLIFANMRKLEVRLARVLIFFLIIVMLNYLSILAEESFVMNS